MTKLAQLKHPDPMHLEAAAGWIQLGDYDSANDELEKIRAEWRAHPDVLDLWVRVPPGVLSFLSFRSGICDLNSEYFFVAACPSG